MKTAAAIITAALPGSPASRSRAPQTIDLLLVLAADVSRSIDEGEFDAAAQGLRGGIDRPARAARRSPAGRPARSRSCFIEWSGAGEQNVVADWTVMRDEEDAGGLAATILAAPRSFIGRTSISARHRFRDGAACRRAAAAPSRRDHRRLGRRHQQFRPPGHRCARRGRGAGRHDQRSRDHQRPTQPGLCLPYPAAGRLCPNSIEQNVIGGPGAFLRVVEDFDSFADAITKSWSARSPARRLPRDTRHCASPSYSRRMWIGANVLLGSRHDEAARTDHPSRRCGGCVAGRRARAAEGDAGDRLP